MPRFCRFVLRTTDVEGASAFYRDLLGARFWGDGIDVVQLPPAVAARGAPAHWLGYIGVEDVVGTARRFVKSGATQLGAPPQSGVANREAVLRDPFGAIVALTPRTIDADDTRVAWHLLSTRDEESAFALYQDLFGWARGEAYDLGATRGRHITFGWNGPTRVVGSASDLARQPHVHPQWLFFFPTDDLERSLASVRAMDGLTLAPTTTAAGEPGGRVRRSARGGVRLVSGLTDSGPRPQASGQKRTPPPTANLMSSLRNDSLRMSPDRSNVGPG